MRRMFVYAALLAVAGIAPASAERLYVPVVGAQAADGHSLATQIWVANVSPRAQAVAAKFLGAGETRTFAVERGGRMLDRLAGDDAVGLVAVDAADESAVSAWVGGGVDGNLSEVPVIGSHDSYHAGASPILADFAANYDRLLIGAANLSTTAASCQATLFSASGGEIAHIPFEVAPQSLYREDAAAWTATRAASAQVSCNQQFYPVAVATAQDGTHVSWSKGIGPNGPCSSYKNLDPQSDGTLGFDIKGVYHQPTPANPKYVTCITLPSQKSFGKIVYEWDITAGPWYPKKPSGIHNLGYYFGQRYRSGVLGNVNALGVGKYALKIMQNYGMPIHSNTNASTPYQLQQGKLYHAKYTFDANNVSATLDWYDANGAKIKSITAKTSPGNGRSVVLKPYGANGLSAVAEFGNYASFGAIPEVPTYGWVYGNFSVRATPK